MKSTITKKNTKVEPKVIKKILVAQPRPESEKSPYFELERNIYELKTCWSYIRNFFEIFGIQIYFLWTL